MEHIREFSKEVRADATNVQALLAHFLFWMFFFFHTSSLRYIFTSISPYPFLEEGVCRQSIAMHRSMLRIGRTSLQSNTMHCGSVARVLICILQTEHIQSTTAQSISYWGKNETHRAFALDSQKKRELKKTKASLPTVHCMSAVFLCSLAWVLVFYRTAKPDGYIL